eukprot:CAMPEP_0196805464 /NCGR_PEP_ID=MMETSP1362-20130617/5235_1 /TAXON_ID=163516 /ORGANISM="Leptocylindrus danicus, Strain CCMP1856" /LENGTH=421 /DNA_ID=CAMNT_0042178405 /DNA_START=93 /DNA_END=1358 /DNA_ORIENTATION=+
MSKIRKSNANKDEDDGNEETLDAKTSERILKLSHAQILEEEQRQAQENAEYEFDSDSGAGSDDEEVFDEEEGEFETDEIVVHDSGYVSVDGPGLTAEEEAMVAAMCGKSGTERRNLADIIFEKINEGVENAQQQAHEGQQPGDAEEFIDLPPKVIEVYTDIGKILCRYTAGKLPKAFKVIPCLSNWEEVLYLTRPDLWSPQAMYAATRIFASNLNPRMAQRFYNLVLLDSVRADILENKKLNYHYYMALKKAIYKPAAWFKGILLPLCKENCTLREAAIIASILQKVSIPMHHSAVAIHKLAQMDYNGATSIFLKTLLNKKYSLPAPVIESLVKHFANFIHFSRELPVLWHQSLLVFVQRYKNYIQDERSREMLKLVMKAHSHAKITPEIRRELFGNQAWKDSSSKSFAGSVATGAKSMEI